MSFSKARLHSFSSDSKLLSLPSDTGGWECRVGDQSRTVHLCCSFLLTPRPAQLLHGLQFLQDHPAPARAVCGLQFQPPALAWGPLRATLWKSAPAWTSPQVPALPGTPPPLLLSDLAVHRAGSQVFPHVPARHFVLSQIHFRRSTTSIAGGLGCVLWWVHWGTIWNQPCLGMGQP